MRTVVACPAPSPRRLPVIDVAAAAVAVGLDAETADSVASAVDRGRVLAGPDGLVVVTGSLYVVAEARARGRVDGLDRPR